ncbi:MAG TPA: hypothetical protein VGF28_04435 [Thermoanaerobaculia bacterium]
MERTVKNAALSGAGAALLVSAIAIGCELYALSPRGSGQWLGAPLAAVLLLMASAFVFMLASIFLAPPWTRRVADAVAMFCFVYFVVGVLGAVAERRMRMDAFAQLARRSEPLVAAIHAFEDDHGRPPASLAELVPRYLPAVPQTRMGAYPHYVYETGNEWLLRVPASTGPMNFDAFVYYPEQRYGRSGTRVGKWAYITD